MGELVANRLTAVGLFEGLAPSSLEALASELVLVEAGAGSTLFQQGEEADSIFIVLEGKRRMRHSARLSPTLRAASEYTNRTLEQYRPPASRRTERASR